MKIPFLIEKTIIVLITILLSVNGCSNDKNPKNYLEKVLNNLNQIESATYYTKSEGWAPGDTSAYIIFHSYVKEYNNPLDTTIGASFVRLEQEDTTKLMFCYDGNMRTLINHNEKRIVLDSFIVRPLPFRPLSPPFFNFTKNILRYILETGDSISLEFEDLKDSVYLRLTIYVDKQVEFFGKAHYMPNSPYNYGETTSRYELWINKSNDLPYKVRREMSHDIIVITCKNVELNRIKIEDFNASDYFPSDYSIQAYRFGRKKVKKNDLVGKIAPNWSLKDVNNKIVSLEELQSKVLMIQFTSVSCGPCRASIPFLKQLALDYKKEKFDLVAIESFNENSNVLRNYQNRNDFKYKFLMSTKDITESYQIKSTPVFFILDENRVIRKVINGYGKDTTDKKIRNFIDGLI